jgi:hypothetical protein
LTRPRRFPFPAATKTGALAVAAAALSISCGRDVADHPPAAAPPKTTAAETPAEPALPFEEALIRDAGLDRFEDALRHVIRPGLRLRLNAAGQLAPANSRFGGLPDVPAKFAWPLVDGAEPMCFLAQINLAEFADFDSALPPQGILYFFCGPDILPAGETSWWEVRYVADTTTLQPAARPASLLDDCAAAAQRVDFVPERTLPGPRSHVLDQMGMPLEMRLAYVERIARPWYGQFVGRGLETASDDRMLGHPLELQGPMQVDCFIRKRWPDHIPESVSDSDFDDAMAQARQDVDNWVLLLQCDAKRISRDRGSVYFWIHRDDLKQGDFEKVLCFVQN